MKKTHEIIQEILIILGFFIFSLGLGMIFKPLFLVAIGLGILSVGLPKGVNQ